MVRVSTRSLPRGVVSPHGGLGTPCGVVWDGSRDAVPSHGTERSAMYNKPGPAAAFVRGPSVIPADQLVVWLEAQTCNGEPLRVRLPLVLRVTTTGIALDGAKIGDRAGALEVYANDAALGIGLADRLRDRCAAGTTCALWAEGYWRGNVDGEYQFDVMMVGEIIAPDDLSSASYVEVESEHGI